jgi:hypothetical protein
MAFWESDEAKAQAIECEGTRVLPQTKFLTGPLFVIQEVAGYLRFL